MAERMHHVRVVVGPGARREQRHVHKWRAPVRVLSKGGWSTRMGEKGEIKRNKERGPSGAELVH